MITVNVKSEIVGSDIKISTDMQEAASMVDSHVNAMSTYVVQTKERLVREALIKLGWTPPGAYDPADAPNFKTLSQISLITYAEMAYKKMQANNEAIEQLRLDNKDLSRLLRECNATRQKDDWK